MSTMSNDPFKLARMAGYYKGVQSAGSAISFGMDAVKTPFLGEILISWLLLLVSLPLCAWVLWYARETNYDIEETVKVDDVSEEKIPGIGFPEGYHIEAESKPVAAEQNVKV